MSQEVRMQVLEEIKDVFQSEGVVYENSMLTKPIMEIGIDSLGFAILVSRLQTKINSDPFTENPELSYPKTLQEFIEAYEARS